jgi:hypothetical protein
VQQHLNNSTTVTTATTVEQWSRMPTTLRQERATCVTCLILNLNEKFGAKINYDIVGVHHVKWRR